MKPSDAPLRCAERWRLGIYQLPRGGPAGERLGSSVGSSMEFHDRRAYAAGDDVRHIDWGVMARTDEVFVRVHQEEVVPRLDLFLDVSKSMASSGPKAQLALDLAAFFVLAAQKDGQDVRVLLLGDRVERIEAPRFLGAGVEWTATRPLPDSIGEAVGDARPRSQRIMVSDFLVPMDPVALVRALSRGADRVALVQVLSQEDNAPDASGAVRLTDAETGEAREVVLDGGLVRRYLERLGRLKGALSEEARRVGGTAHEIVEPATLDDALAGLQPLTTTV